MIRFSLLGSGSSGNAVLVTGGGAKILIDDGFSLKELQRRAELVGETLTGLDGVFITHEHSDHVCGVGVLARKLGVPVYMTPHTHRALSPGVGEIPTLHYFESGDTLRIGGMELTSFSIPHDAADPVSFTIACEGAKMGLATDLGHAPILVKQRLSGSHALVLESNYCPERLTYSPYPEQVRQRIRGRHGHLSNHDMASLLHALLHDALRTVVLIHISENNNAPGLARSLAEQVLRGHKAELHLAEHDAPTPMFEIVA